MKTKIYYLIMLFLSLTVHAQSKEEIIDRVVKNYSAARAIQYSTVYNLYKSEKDKSITQSYKGYFSKSATNDIYAKINNTEFYWNTKITAKISHDEKVIQVLNPVNSASLFQSDHDIKKLLSEYRNGYFKDYKSYWELELLKKPNSGLPFSRVIIQITKDFYIQKQVFYYTTEINFSNDYSKPEMHAPKLEVIYTKPTRKEEPVSKYDTAQFFVITKKRINLSAKYSTYELFDQRKSNSK